MRTRTIIMLLAALMVLNMNRAEGQSHWSQFRGPNGSGIAPDGKKLPVEFDESKNMIWKCAVSKGNSSPCVWGDRIFLTGYADKKLETTCIDRKSGRILWRKSISAKKIERVHPINTPATPTATTDGKRVFVYFGSYGLLCYDFEGREKWKRPLPLPPNMYGTAVSPIKAGDYLIFCCDKKTGSYLEGDHPLWGFFRFLDVDKSGKITVKEWSKMIAFLNSFQQENALMAILPGDGKKETKVVWKHSYGVPECPSY